ncbi:DUF6538 domain-containing protein [Cohaesibacter celericrescens]|uniref:DUF6538 domain-containing protein n=1 Tax=Cohaesibacter celericrescens TaxID=2067669 RepID=A0A2N5XT35_9HYPH|nr:DUF6538 domain-containing protein [Cohaesibacter celericrescens]PLW77676.1 hypothetical protein C0081_10325 [Cohaesibacter celericrescens]
MGSTRELKYITKNRGILYYTRLVPKDVQHLDPRSNPIQKSLKTKNYDIAMSRRDVLVDSDDKFWRSLRAVESRYQSKDELAAASENIMALFNTEKVSLDLSSLPKGKAGLALHNLYQQQLEQIFSGPPEGMLQRFEVWLKTLPSDIAENYRKVIRNTDLIGSVLSNFEDPTQFITASMGIHNQPEDLLMAISEALDRFFGSFAAAHMSGMSAAQEKNYRNPKKRAVERFIDLAGDVPLERITRAQAVLFKDH